MRTKSPTGPIRWLDSHREIQELQSLSILFNANQSHIEISTELSPERRCRVIDGLLLGDYPSESFESVGKFMSRLPNLMTNNVIDADILDIL